MSGTDGEADADALIMCSFCLRSRQEVGRLVAAPGVGICRSCAKSALELFENAGPEPAEYSSGPWDVLDDDQLLSRLPDIAEAREMVEEHLRRWVSAARLRGISWASIGDALGMSRQSAWERFHQHIER